MTHQEIEGYSKRYNLKWQNIFQLDAEFWSLITIEAEEKEKAAAKQAGKANFEETFIGKDKSEEDGDK